MELSDLVFRDPESIRKVAMLVRIFAQLGCQQFQLNSLNADILLDARAHPEKHRDLIVRGLGLERILLRTGARIPGSHYCPHIV